MIVSITLEEIALIIAVSFLIGFYFGIAFHIGTTKARNICIYLIYRNTNLTTADISDYYERQESMARTAFESVRRLMECVKCVNKELNLK